MIKALIFDFDGLILDTEYPEFLSWQAIYEAHGCAFAVEEWAANIGKGASTLVQTPYDDLEARLARPIDRDSIRAQRRARFAELMASEMALPGVGALLTEAKRRSLKLAVASSSSRDWVSGYLQTLGLAQYFACICCEDDVRRAKPDPELYLAALAGLGCTAEEAIAFEDSPNGILAAKGAGIFCVVVPNRLTRHAQLGLADIQVESLADLSVDELFQQVANGTTENKSRG